MAIEKPVAAAPLDDLRPLRWQRDKNGVISDFIRRKPGGFVAYDVPPGTYRVLLPDSFRRAYVLEGPDTGPMRVTADAALPVEKTLALRERRRAPLTVRVVDGESGAPISQAKVFVEDALGQTRRSPTDADGRVAFEAVPEGTLRLSAGHWTHETAERGIAHPHDDPLTVRLTPLPVIEGRLTSDGFDTFERMRILAVDRDSG
ncbi:MAG: carboxypeptidase-like regulatory domain-containing protein, partial [Planctomycetota bacterium]|nr:carboxypeptidase-like regulatory domain-containing protein [Planctomycetota bacterium]